MSKSNRIKGTFSPVYGCRLSPIGRCEDLEQRKAGLTKRHSPTPSKRVIPKITKTQRKLLAKIPKNEANCHPLQRKATAMERGAALMMGLVSSFTTEPELAL